MNVNRIKELLTIKKLTIRDLARKINGHEMTIHAFFRSGNTRISTLQKIANALDVNISELLDDKKDIPAVSVNMVEEPREEYNTVVQPVPIKRFHAGEIINARREQIGMTQKELARRLGTTSQNIAHLEKRRTINFDQIVAINRILSFNLFDNLCSHDNTTMQHEIEMLRAQVKDKERIIRLLEENAGIKKR